MASKGREKLLKLATFAAPVLAATAAGGVEEGTAKFTTEAVKRAIPRFKEPMRHWKARTKIQKFQKEYLDPSIREYYTKATAEEPLDESKAYAMGYDISDFRGGRRRRKRRSAKRSAKRSVRRSAKRSAKRSVKRSVRRSVRRSAKRSVRRSLKRRRRSGSKRRR